MATSNSKSEISKDMEELKSLISKSGSAQDTEAKNETQAKRKRGRPQKTRSLSHVQNEEEMPSTINFKFDLNHRLRPQRELRNKAQSKT